ncbi:hypothetical protein [Bradyrhizobium sp. LHD-71]|uniref:hypothetical protein n=1 Tax=Bradyrhizobium sp. LHD-71 TaxID=3072141 RepID=UPI00280C6B43|nr:hypothetical protein [Bradyrhizobium sp. LHD-71]MDQ8732610.1 hypothetical protein [Bradyrhizobium sp. LHD-71]
MLRRALIILLIASVAALSHQPAFALMLPPAAQAGAAMAGDAAGHDEVVMHDATADAMPCSDMMAQADPAQVDHDCCGDVDKAEKSCPDAGACAARCHVNGALEPAWFEHRAGETIAFRIVPQEARALVPVSAKSLFRPPIL